MDWRARLPWVDATAAAVAGGVVLTLSDLLSAFYALPPALLTFNGWVSLGYSVFGLSLVLLPREATRVRRAVLGAMVTANAGWALACVGMVIRFGEHATGFGVAHLVGEAAFVATLAVLEWRSRRVILSPAALSGSRPAGPTRT